MNRFQYLAVLGVCLALTVPLEFALGLRVLRRPRLLLRVLAPTVAVFVVWDLVAIRLGHWTFDPRFVTGWRLPGSLPVEELAFFAIIPLCGLLTFGSVTKLRDR